jgi:hypothetical protein
LDSVLNIDSDEEDADGDEADADADEDEEGVFYPENAPQEEPEAAIF